MNRTLKTWAAVLAMALMMFAFTGCSDDDDPAGPGTTPIDETAVVTAAGDAYFTTYKIDVDGDGTRETGVNIAASGDLVAALGDYYIIDWRAPADYANAHIPGAVNMSLGSLVTEIDNLPTNQVILNVCYSGQTASYATSIINLLGTQTGHKARNLKFGMSGYAPLNMVKADGSYNYPTSDDYAAAMTTDDTPKNAAGSYPALDTGATTELDVLKARAQEALDRWTGASTVSVFASAADVYPLNTDDWYLVNYFSPANYAEGHLPGAVQYSTSPSGFLTTEFLNTLPTDKNVAVYCYTGQTSAQAAAYLGMVGYSAKTVTYGVQKMCYNDATINDVPWHGPNDPYPLEGTGVVSK